MARSERPPKVPDPTVKTVVGYFDNTGDGGIRCVGAALSLNPRTHIIICASDIVHLKAAWSELTDMPLDIKRTQILLYRYETPQERLMRDQVEDMKIEIAKEKVRPTRPAKAMPSQWYWYYHAESDCCFIEESSFAGDGLTRQIGEANACTVDECKAILRKMRMPRSEIESMSISTSVDDLIPF